MTETKWSRFDFVPVSCTLAKTHKLLQVCKQVVTNLFTSCQQVVFALLVPSCCNKFGTSCQQCNLWQPWWHYQTCYKVVRTSLIQSWYNKNVTRLTTQVCNNIVIPWLHRTCWNNLATSLIISTRLLQVVNSLFQTCWQLGTSSAKTTCWRLATRCFQFDSAKHRRFSPVLRFPSRVTLDLKEWLKTTLPLELTDSTNNSMDPV
jgi:hypothetical protein